MPRHVFYSFHYAPDNWRVQQIRNMGVVEGNAAAHPNTWEQVKRQGDLAIKSWINTNMNGKSCVVVLIGAQTAGRPWINYEIERAWNQGKGLLGVRIHGLLDRDQRSSSPGRNPFAEFMVGGRSLADYVPLVDPTGATSQDTYQTIAANLPSWIDHAVKLRRPAA